MATITGLTASAMLAIKNQTVINGSIDSSGHLTLVQFDGSIIDAGYFPAATTSVSGFVELATTGETDALSDSSRAVTPASLVNIAGRISDLEANPVNIISGVAESALYTAYPSGMSLMVLTTGSGWTPNGGLGAVITYLPGNLRAEQTFYSSAGGSQSPRTWIRTYHTTNGGGGWTAWSVVSTVATLTPGSFAQTNAFTDYPQGESRLYYTSSTSGSWDFSGTAGEVRTYVDGTDFARQTFNKHVGGTTAQTAMWIRTANSASGWSAWEVVATSDPLHPLPTRMTVGQANITPSAANVSTSVTITFPAGMFTIPPAMSVTANSSSPGTAINGVSASNVTTTGAMIWLNRNSTATTGVWWMAVQ